MLTLPLIRSFEHWYDMSFKKLRDIVTVPGNGRLSAVVHPVGSFLRLHLSVPGALELIHGDEEKVVITTDENLHDFFEIVNSGRTLYITPGGRLRRPGFTSVRIQVFVRQIDTLHFAFSGGNLHTLAPIVSAEPLEVKIQANGDTTLQLEAPALKVRVASNGDTTLLGACDTLDARTQSNGHFDSRALLARHLILHNQSNGNAWVYGSETLRIRHRANGFVQYFGEGRLKEIVQMGTGQVTWAGK